MTPVQDIIQVNITPDGLTHKQRCRVDAPQISLGVDGLTHKQRCRADVKRVLNAGVETVVPEQDGIQVNITPDGLTHKRRCRADAPQIHLGVDGLTHKQRCMADWLRVLNVEVEVEVPLETKGIASYPRATGDLPNIVVESADDWAIIKGLTTVTAETEQIVWGYKGLTGQLTFLNLTALKNLYIYGSGHPRPPILTGMTALELLVLTGLQLTAPPDLTGCTALKRLDLQVNQLITPPVLTGLIALGQLNLQINSLTTPPDITDCVALWRLNLEDLSLSTACIDVVLAAIRAHTVNNGDLLLTGNSVPGVQGLLDKTVLEGRGWDVFVDE